MTSLCKQGLVWILLAIGVMLPARAQFDTATATVLGTVRDASAAAAPGARVTLQNLDTGITQVAATDSDGNY